MAEPFVSNILSNKYDTALDFHVTMYDELPYDRDRNYCNREKLTMHSKNLLKFYIVDNEKSIIDNGDDEIEEYLSRLLLKQSKSFSSTRSQAKIEEKEPEVTEKQIQTLLDDDAEIPEPIDPFAGVEDW